MALSVKMQAVVRLPVSQLPVVKDFLAAYQRKKLLGYLDVVSNFILPTLDSKSI